jgi:glucose dehydrogenase
VAKSWLLAALAMVCCAGRSSAQSAPDLGWPNYGNDAGGTRYSAAQQIDRTNVAQLKLASTYRTGALFESCRTTKPQRHCRQSSSPVWEDVKKSILKFAVNSA